MTGGEISNNSKLQEKRPADQKVQPCYQRLWKRINIMIIFLFNLMKHLRKLEKPDHDDGPIV